MVVLMLLVRKLGNKLRFHVDYKTFNIIIVKNRYLILSIHKMLEKLLNAEQFMKLDIIHAFNKICTKKRQKQLMAFNIKYSQFKYLVIQFRLCNKFGIF